MTQKPKGTADFFPDTTEKLQYIENTVRSAASRFGFGEIRTPTFESTELFARGVGSTSDVVQKEMYTFIDRDGPSFTLRPEGTAGAARAIIENGKYGEAMPLKYYYIINCFRHERPQAGRFREFSQFGAEMYGSDSPAADITVISLANTVIKELNIKNVTLHINTIGCPNCRPAYHKKLKEYFSSKKEELCPTCLSRLESNPMRILDCKSPICKDVAKDAPKALDNLCPECANHFENLKKYLKALNIDYVIDTSIVRGLDYYTRTVFEFICDDIGAQSTICGGGRYDGLMEEIGGSHLPACGFALGITRLLPTVTLPEKKKGPILYIAPMGEDASLWAVSQIQKLRDKGLYAETDTVGRSLKAQMKYADKIGAAYTLVLGDNELQSGRATLKSMSDGLSCDIGLDGLCEHICKLYNLN